MSIKISGNKLADVGKYINLDRRLDRKKYFKNQLLCANITGVTRKSANESHHGGVSGLIETTFDLYKYNSKNIYFYKVESSGLYSDCFDDTDCFHIMKNENDALVIDLFKAKCEDIYTLDGDLDDDELEGHEITFTE